MTTCTLPILMAWGFCPPDVSGFEVGLVQVLNFAADALAKFGVWLVEFGHALAAHRGIL